MRLRYAHLPVALLLLTLLMALLSSVGFTATRAQTQRAGTMMQVARVLPQRDGSATAATFPATMSEDFENTWPAPGWSLQDFGSSGGEYLLGQRNCQPQNGAFAGWVVGGGADGTALPCGSDYPNKVDSEATYGPFDLSAAVSSTLTFSYRGASEQIYDYLFVGASIDDFNYCGYLIDGDHNSGYSQLSLDLNNIDTIACPLVPSSLLGYPNATIIVKFISDANVTDIGFTVDDIALLTTYPPPPTDTPTATLTDTPTNTPTITPVGTPPNPPTNTPTSTPVTPRPVFLPLTMREKPQATPTPTPTIPPSASPCPDDVEPNDTPEKSKQLTTINRSCIGSFQDQLNTQVPDDYFVIQPKSGQRIIVELTGIPSDANYDIALVRQDGPNTYPPVARSETTGPANERFEYLIDSNKLYYVRVRAKAKSTSAKNTYVLTVSIK